jgi:hypothetical protein
LFPLKGCDLRYLFEDYAFDTERRELRRGVNLVAISPQVFDLLAFLIQNRERVVSKDELIAAVWAGRIISDAALTTRLNVARGAIGDSGDMGFGSYETAWTWLHKLRAAMVRPNREPLGPFAQVDETLVGGKGSPNKELVLVAAEVDGRVRLAHAETSDEGTLKSFADSQIALDTQVVTDGLASYNSDSLGKRPHQAIMQTKQERRESDALQGCHWTTSLLKRWLLGTHAGAVRPKHLQAYLDEFAFRHNRRKTIGVGRIAARVIEQLVAHEPLPMRSIIDQATRCRWFTSDQRAAPA